MKLNSKLLYYTCGYHFFKITTKSIEEADKLKSEQEEADASLILHAAHVPPSNKEGFLWTYKCFRPRFGVLF